MYTFSRSAEGEERGQKINVNMIVTKHEVITVPVILFVVGNVVTILLAISSCECVCSEGFWYFFFFCIAGLRISINLISFSNLIK